MNVLQILARMIGVREDQAEDALRCAPRAREAVVLSRRGFFAAGAVMAAAPLAPTKTFSFLFEPTFEEELERIVGADVMRKSRVQYHGWQRFPVPLLFIPGMILTLGQGES